MITSTCLDRLANKNIIMNKILDIEVEKIIKPITTSDGAGVKLKRSVGVDPNYFDPFLMLDEFGSENKDDYVAGFPAHPHRGIETVTYMLSGDFKHKDSTGGEVHPMFWWSKRLKEVIALVVDDDKCREVLDFDPPDRFHPQFFVLNNLDFLDTVEG